MSFALIIVLRILFIACMVFIIGYVFGPFAKNRVLKVITRVAAILAIVLFISTNALSHRFHRWYGGHHPADRHCMYEERKTERPAP